VQVFYGTKWNIVKTMGIVKQPVCLTVHNSKQNVGKSRVITTICINDCVYAHMYETQLNENLRLH